MGWSTDDELPVTEKLQPPRLPLPLEACLYAMAEHLVPGSQSARYAVPQGLIARYLIFSQAPSERVRRKEGRQIGSTNARWPT